MKAEELWAVRNVAERQALQDLANAHGQDKKDSMMNLLQFNNAKVITGMNDGPLGEIRHENDSATAIMT